MGSCGRDSGIDLMSAAPQIADRSPHHATRWTRGQRPAAHQQGTRDAAAQAHLKWLWPRLRQIAVMEGLTREELLIKLGAARARARAAWRLIDIELAPKAHRLTRRRSAVLYGLTMIGITFCLQRRLERRFYTIRY
jgi:hypothetical protein